MEINNESLICLTKSLNYNIKLNKLELRISNEENISNEETYDKFFQTIEINKSLTYLDLRFPQYSNIKSLCNCLKYNKYLRTFRMSKFEFLYKYFFRFVIKYKFITIP